MSDSRPIGVFDSGIGGLTVAGALTRAMPHERIVYLGDTARVPYGSKSPDVVQRYAERCARFLMQHDIKLLVIACNTASAFALDTLRAALPVPVVGVIAPGARAAVLASRGGAVGVIGTHGTIGSGAYRRAILELSPQATVIERACPLFVPLAEEGWVDHAATQLVAETYLQPLKDQGVDTLVLGCTHYPVLRDVIGRVMGEGVTLCDSAISATEAAQAALLDKQVAGVNREASVGSPRPEHAFFLTDAQPNFVTMAQRFFGASLADAQRVDI